MQIVAAQPDPFAEAKPMAKLQYMLKGIKRNEAVRQKEPRERLPITPHLLKHIKKVWFHA